MTMQNTTNATTEMNNTNDNPVMNNDKNEGNTEMTNVINNMNNDTTNEGNNTMTNNENEINDVIKEINGVLETVIKTNTVLNTDEISEVLGAIRGIIKTITAPDEESDENEVDNEEVLIDTLLSDESDENDPVESKTWTEECFLDRMGASQVLKEWADITTDHFIDLYSENMWNAHPDETAVRVPVRFHNELRNLGVQVQTWKPGNGYLWNGVWYFPADREFLIIVREE